MPSSSSPAAAAAAPKDTRLQSVLETQGLKFHIKAGNAKWACTVLDRATHERQKASRTGSSSSVSTTDSETSSTISK